MPESLAALVAFVREHQHRGELDGGRDAGYVWLARSCGAHIAHPASTPPPTPAQQIQTRSPESYTPKRLAEKIFTSKKITSKAALEGERKQVMRAGFPTSPPSSSDSTCT
jgi:hypothetical protein